MATIEIEVYRDEATGEQADTRAGYPPRLWMCPCGAGHRRGFFPVGTLSHRCLRCGFVGEGGHFEEPASPGAMP